MTTGTYILQSNRAVFNKSIVDPTCLLCGAEPETMAHFLLKCDMLDVKRRTIYTEIAECVLNVTGIDMSVLPVDEQLQIILDIGQCTIPELSKMNIHDRSLIEHHTRRLCYALHSSRYYQMRKIPTRKRDGL